MNGSKKSPPLFSWDDWYNYIGGRSIQIAEADSILHDKREYQYPKFTGEINPEQTFFESPAAASAAIKKKALELAGKCFPILQHIIIVRFAFLYVCTIKKSRQKILMGSQPNYFLQWSYNCHPSLQIPMYQNTGILKSNGTI